MILHLHVTMNNCKTAVMNDTPDPRPRQEANFTIIGFHLPNNAYWVLGKTPGIKSFAYHKQDGKVYVYSKIWKGKTTPTDDEIREEWEKCVETFTNIFDNDTFGTHHVRKVFYRVKDRMLARDEFEHLKPVSVVDVEQML